MREVHYIDTDEEIISAVSRLRQSGQGENVFIFPKRALILQSIVNLRLLEREAKKLGKQIIVMSQDEAGKKLAEKAGLLVEEYQDQAIQETRAQEATRFTVEHTGGTIPLPEKMTVKETAQHSNTIGSDSFFTTGVAPTKAILPSAQEVKLAQEKPLPPMPPTQKLRIRDVSPTPLTSLNSKRTNEPLRPIMQTVLPQPIKTQSPPQQSNTISPIPSPPVQRVPERGRRLERFMGTKAPQAQSLVTHESTTPSSQRRPSATPPQFASAHTSLWKWVFLSFVIMLVGGGLSWYVFFPKALITLQPQTAEQVVRFQVTATTDPSMQGEGVVKGRIITLERSVQLTGEATGSGTSDTAKARGKIRIYNDFSQDKQVLVATTRFETADGKIFRLLQGVTVPGTTGTGEQHTRGMVEATVVADQTGSEYNIGPTTFTIPGFKGSPKFDKFTAESTQAFTGGGGNATNATKVVSQSDLDQAKMKAQDEIKRRVLEEVRTQLNAGEAILEDSMQFTEKVPNTLPALGTATPSFSYEMRFETKTFIVDETAIKKRIAEEHVKSGEVTLVPWRYDVRYSALLPKYDTGKIDMTVESTVEFQSEIDKEKYRQALLGLDEAGIREFLEKHPEVERLQVEFKPHLIISTIPSNEKRVQLEVLMPDKGGH